MIDVLALPLAVVFAVAAVAKLADLDGSQRAVAGFGMPDRLARPLGLALPGIELAIALLLVPATTSRYAAIAAVALLGVFSAAISISLARGRRPDCHCFGRLHSAPAGWGTLVRNLALGAVAVVIAFVPAGNPSWLALGVAACAIAVIAQAALWIMLLRRYGRALQQLDELRSIEIEPEAKPLLASGDTMPAFDLPLVGGGRLALGELLDRGLPLLLVLTDERCGSCVALYPDLARWDSELGDRVTIAVLGLGSAESLTAFAQEHGLESVLVADPATFQMLGVEATPGAFVVAPDGHLATELRYGAIDIEMLLLDTVEASGLEEVAHHG